MKDKSTGRVTGHVRDTKYLMDPVFKVSDKGRNRVIREGRKNVHAGIEATLDDFDYEDMDWRPITYDPKKNKSFIFRDSGKPIKTGDAAAIRLSPEGVSAGKLMWDKVASANTEKTMNMVGFISGFEKRARGERIVSSIGKVFGKAKRGPKPRAAALDYNAAQKRKFKDFSSKG